MNNINGAGYVYFLQAKNGLIKIGETCDLIRRLNGHKRHWYGSFEFRLVWVIETTNRVRLEGWLHTHFNGNKNRVRVSGDWFDLTAEDMQEVIDTYPLTWFDGGGV